MTAVIIPFPVRAAVIVSRTLDGWRLQTPAGPAWLYALRAPAVAQAKAIAAALRVPILKVLQ
jgi:hypothetical protein